jgi:amidase
VPYGARMSTFITRLETSGDGPRLAVKDLIDVAGVPTTAGSRALERRAKPAERDAACLAGARAAGARIVGKANLHELAMLPIGTNPWFGTPVNPLDPTLIPGGSSSGSAVAVATDEADVALGSDTGGSIRVPAACCGIAGLKTTYGRVSVDGVWPLAKSLDTIGPMAADVSGLVLGMQLLEPGFAPSPVPARRIGRLRTKALPALEAAVDDALREAGFEVVTLDWEGLDIGSGCFTATYFDEIWEADHELVEADPEGVGSDVHETLALVDMFRAGRDEAQQQLAPWRQSLFALFEQVELLALPTLPILPPRLDAVTEETMMATVIDLTAHVSLFNAAGTPCTAQPVPLKGSQVPASLQLVGPLGGEELLLATAARVEAAVRSS